MIDVNNSVLSKCHLKRIVMKSLNFDKQTFDTRSYFSLCHILLVLSER